MRPIPLRLHPQEGEAADSWMVRLAHRYGLNIYELAPVISPPEYKTATKHLRFIREVPPSFLRHMEQMTGLQHRVLDAAVMDRYNGIFRNNTLGTLYCPACLRASDGVWKLSWRLPFEFACLEHKCFLQATCPGCDLPPRTKLTRFTGLLSPTVCTNLLTARSTVCGTDLVAPGVTKISGDDPRLAAQSWINARLHSREPKTVDELRDFTIIAKICRQRIIPEDVASMGHSTVEAVNQFRDIKLQGLVRQPGTDAPLVNAAVATLTIAMLESPDDATQFKRFTSILRKFTSVQGMTKSPDPHTFPFKRLAELSPQTQEQLLRSFGSQLRVTDKLRYRVNTSTPHYPNFNTYITTYRASQVPMLLWRDWLLRFLPPGFYAERLAKSLSAALLIPGNPQNNTNIQRNSNLWQPHFGHILTKLSEFHPDVVTAICNIADYLDNHGSPINYERRRRSFTDIQLSQDEWEILCDNSRMRFRREAMKKNTERYLFQLLTGSEIPSSNHRLAFPSLSSKEYYLVSFRPRFPAEFRHELYRIARKFLQSNMIEEPMEWSPPTDCIQGLYLPGELLTPAEKTHIEESLTDPEFSTESIATKLGTSIEHIRFHLENLEHPPNTMAQVFPQEQRPRRRLAQNILTKSFLQHELVKLGKTVKAIAAETRFTTETVRSHARAHGIPAPNLPREHPIDYEWLREQMEVLHRSNADIARELGVSTTFVFGRRRKLNIQPEKVGPNLTRQYPDFPPLVRKVLKGHTNGFDWLKLIQQISQSSSMGDAAKKMGYRTSNLQTTVSRVEKAVGGPIFHHASNTESLKLTPLGQELLSESNRPDIQAQLEIDPIKRRSDNQIPRKMT